MQKLCVGKEFLQTLFVCARNDDTVFVAALRLLRLVGQKVSFGRFLEHGFATAGDADALLCSTVRLELHERKQKEMMIVRCVSLLILCPQSDQNGITCHFWRCVYCSNIF